jgi:hypothetical protein
VFDRRASDPHVPARRAPHGYFTKRRVMTVPFDDVPELVFVTLLRNRGAGGDGITAADQDLR